MWAKNKILLLFFVASFANCFKPFAHQFISNILGVTFNTLHMLLEIIFFLVILRVSNFHLYTREKMFIYPLNFQPLAKTPPKLLYWPIYSSKPISLKPRKLMLVACFYLTMTKHLRVYQNKWLSHDRHCRVPNTFSTSY